MNARVYLLLNIVPGESEMAARLLRNGTGVLEVDHLEGPPDLIAVIEAPQRQSLAQLTVKAIASVENITREIQLLPVQDATILASPENLSTTSTARQSVTKGAAVTRRNLENHQ